jgi:hypothetical protein
VAHLPHPKLEAAIREAISESTGDIEQFDVQVPIRLDALERDVIYLAGLEHALNAN